ncbi:MAG: transposase [Candidatus Bathyarchaeia archaeon]
MPVDYSCAKLKRYRKRWMAETAFSTFKRLLGGCCLLKTPRNIAKELMAKAYIYNMIINL